MSTKAKHTPGPWRIGRPSVANGVQIFKDSDWPRRSDVICTMPRKGGGRTANARLIAAAPDLYGQLAALTVQLEEAHLHVPPGVLSALAKARGEKT